MEKFIIWAILVIMAGFGYVEGVFYTSTDCQAHRNSSVNTVYRSNVINLLGSLVNNAPLQNGYFNNSFGNGSNQVYGLAWCRGDVSPHTCSECLTESLDIPFRACCEFKDMTAWFSFCTIRFSNKSFFGKEWNTSVVTATYGYKELDDPSVFSQGFSMMENIARNVSNQPLMFNTGAIDVGENGGRYGLGQCIQVLSKSHCENSLQALLLTFQPYVLNQTVWTMRGVSCGMWYDDVRFYDNNSTLTPTPNSTLTPTPNSNLSPTPNSVLTLTPATSGGGERWYKGDVILALVAFLVFQMIA